MAKKNKKKLRISKAFLRIGIIGAGISGLSAGYELSRKGHKVVIYERLPIPGGLGTYIKVKDNYIERFYHHLFEGHIHLKTLAQELGVANKLKFYYAKTGILSGGNIFPFSSPAALLRFTPLSFLNRLRLGALVAAFKFLPFVIPGLDLISAQKFIKKYAGQEVYKTVWGPLLNGKFSAYSKTVPALWLWGRIKDRSLNLGYFDGSIKVLFDALIKKIRAFGGEIKLNTEIVNVKINDNKVEITDKTGVTSFDKVIITAVSPITNFLIKEILPKNLQKHLSSIDHLGAVCLLLELKHPIQSQYWLNICEPKAPVLVMVEHTNLIPVKAYGGRTIVYLANYIHRNDKRFKMTDKEVLETYTSILKKLNKNYSKSWIVKSCISRVPRAQTIFKIGALKKKPPIEIVKPYIYMVNIDQMYPHDRDLNQGAQLGKKAAKAVLK